MKVKCDCECHEPGVVMLHAIPCCHDGWVEKSQPLFFSGRVKNADGSLGEVVSGQFGSVRVPDYALALAVESPALRSPKFLLGDDAMSIPVNVDNWDQKAMRNFLKAIDYDPMVVTFGKFSHTDPGGSEPIRDMAFLVMPAELIGKRYRLVPMTDSVDRPRPESLPPAMTLTQLIEWLSALKAEHGDLPVRTADMHGTQSYPLYEFAVRACRMEDGSTATIVGTPFLANPAIA